MRKSSSTARATRPNFTYPFNIFKGGEGIVAEVAHLRDLVIKMIDTDIEAVGLGRTARVIGPRAF